MIAIDTSSLIAYFSDQSGSDLKLVDEAFEKRIAVFPPVVLSEILSDPKLSKESKSYFQKVPLLEITAGFWVRVGDSRSRILKRGLRARLADALIAQCCIDHQVPLITRDSDFRHFAKHCGLTLA